MRAPEHSEWAAVVPVKELHLAKSRLAPLPADARADLALAMAHDVVAAALACPAVSGVVVVTNDVRAARDLGAAGAQVVADVSDAGLNPALVDGARFANAWWPRAGVVALASDLPCLDPGDLAVVLTEATGHARAAVADARGDGTVLLAARAASELDPRWGPASFTAHELSGARPLATATPRLRRDVDTVDDLRAALRLGAGPATGAVAAALGLTPG